MTAGIIGRRSLAIVAAFSVVISLSKKASAEDLRITSVHPDIASGSLVIDGTGFRSGLYVGLENVDLKVLSVKPHELKTTLPALQSGSYRLEIHHGRGDSARF